MALLISIYSAIDGAVVKRTESLGHATLIYFVSALYMTPFILWWHGWYPLMNEFSAHDWQLLGIGVLIVSAYLMALFANSIASVGYSGSIREVGVVMGAFAVRQFLGEKFGGVRVGGAVVIVIRMLVIAFFG